MISPRAAFHLREATAGLTTFLTMAYIVVVNPAILSSEGTGMPFSGVMTATVLVCAVMTLLMGVGARLPFAVAPGMGINAFFTFTIILGQQVPWRTALGMVFWSGVLFVLLSATPLRMWVAQAVPLHVRLGAAAGIGLFLCFIGLKNAGLVVADPVTLVRPGPLGTASVLALAGLALMAGLQQRGSPLALVVGMAAVTVGSWAAGMVKLPAVMVAAPDFSLMGQLDLWGALQPALLPATAALLFTDFFDSVSTFMGVAHATGQTTPEGQPRRLKEGLLVDAFATLGSALFGTSSGTTYMESAAGIHAGGTTGWTSVYTAVLFVPCLFLAPLAGAIPPYATGPVLVLVGALMFRSITHVRLEKLEETVPAFLATALIPLTFSITQGMVYALLAHVVLFAAAGRRAEVSNAMWVLAGICALMLFVV